MSKLVTVPLASLTNEASAVNNINNNFEAVETAMENTLSRDGTSPNQMLADIDMNSNDLINAGSVRTDALWLNNVPISPGTLFVADQDYGDITVSGGNTVWSINAGVVDNTKAADMAQNTIKGRINTGVGDPQDLTGSQVRIIAGLSSTDSPQFNTIELGNSSDTTLSRIAAGRVAVEGEELATQTYVGGNFLPLIGGTLTGAITITPTTANPSILLNTSTSTAIPFLRLANPNGAWQVRQETDGTFNIRQVSGNNVISADLSGVLTLPYGQLKFPSTQAPSSDANTLDDYKEGTFTPAIAFGGSSAGVTYATQLGYYVKVGRLVHVQLYIKLTSNGTGVGAATISGLPYAAYSVNSVNVLNCANWSGCSGVVGNPTGYIALGTSVFNLLMSGAAASVVMTDTNITDTAGLYFSGTYLTGS